MIESGDGICVFSPGLRLTVTIEIGPHGEEIHLHPGGQGYWLARSIERFGEPVVLCATVGGEVGAVLAPLLRSQTGIELVAVQQAASSSVSMYDRRSGTRTIIARSEPGQIDRHAVDKLYSLTLAHAIGRRCCVLAGLAAVLDSAPIQLLKVSDEDLREDGVVGDDSDNALALAVNELAARVARDLVVTRGRHRPAVARSGGRWYTVTAPQLTAIDWRGAGDAMAGAMAVAYCRGATGVDVLRFGAAAGAASVTRRGLASLDAELVEALLPRVRVDQAADAAYAVRSWPPAQADAGPNFE